MDKPEQIRLAVAERQFTCPKPFATFEACVAEMQGEVEDPEAFCAAWEQECSGRARNDMETERRWAPPAATEIRILEDEDNKPRLRGTGIVFESWSEDLGGFREKIEPGAVEGLIDRADIRVLFNHDPNLVLGRTRSSTARLYVTDRGVDYEVDLPDTSAGRDVRESVRRGDVTGSSFTFRVAPEGELWQSNNAERIITEFSEIREMGPVTWPAYTSTVVAARALKMAERRGMRFGEVLRLMVESDDRARLDLIAELAQAAEITPDTVSSYMEGRVVSPTLALVETFAKVLNIPAERLIKAAERDGCEFKQAERSGVHRAVARKREIDLKLAGLGLTNPVLTK